MQSRVRYQHFRRARSSSCRAQRTFFLTSTSGSSATARSASRDSGFLIAPSAAAASLTNIRLHVMEFLCNTRGAAVNFQLAKTANSTQTNLPECIIQCLYYLIAVSCAGGAECKRCRPGFAHAPILVAQRRGDCVRRGWGPRENERVDGNKSHISRRRRTPRASARAMSLRASDIR